MNCDKFIGKKVSVVLTCGMTVKGTLEARSEYCPRSDDMEIRYLIKNDPMTTSFWPKEVCAIKRQVNLLAEVEILEG